MKKYVAFAFLTLSLAACSQQAVQPAQPAAQFRTTPIGQGGQTYSTTSEALEAQVIADLNRRGFGDTLSAQGLAPQVYLNVLPVPTSDDSVRAYVKSSFASPVTCSVTWGDGSASTSVASPTVGRIETKDHAYATFGTYTITTSCVNGATVVGTQSVTVQAGKKVTGVTLNFDTPPVASRDVRFYQSYQEQGYQIYGTGNQDVVQPSKDFGNGFHPRPSQPIANLDASVTLQLASIDQAPFTLKSFDFAPAFGNEVGFTLTGYKADGNTITASLDNPDVAYKTITLDSSWTNLKRVTFGNVTGSANYVLDNISLSK
ncbi:hypothetical protein EHF33_14630 [Deinococcus psychrotolerans]|uniref:PKD domain-containing protein n=1 Tax=Deinococcus psychrotolerans TaxID=2489213 RepID=A0A3G8YFR5_9DEIO|nr:hypothetical protein [Deinococcus psychrotolerans]AZI44138.1 hypothetical protein EHF33_14630 [Deinococcus psychrotolerans]